MPADEPRWWYGDRRAAASMLRPAGWLYGAVAERRYRRRRGYRSRLPVICVGNLTAGGTGKTPLSLLIAEYLMTKGETPAFLTRGHGGRLAGPAWVDAAKDGAARVGDEPLLLARVAPTMVARDRKEGALAIERGAGQFSVVVMDDGLQNPSLSKDLALAVIDGSRGVGNGLVIPAGPLRAPLAFQMALAHALVVNGPAGATLAEGDHPLQGALRRRFGGPILVAEPSASGDVDWLKGLAVVAYAGIGNPNRFFDLLKTLGATLAETRAFADHHPFSERDAGKLLDLAAARGAALVTTEKDLARLSGCDGKRAELLAASRALPIRLVFRDEDGERIAAMIDAALATGGYRTAR